MMANPMKLSLVNFDSNSSLSLYSNLLRNETAWLFNKNYPKEILFISHAYNGNYYNTYIQQVRNIFGLMGIAVRLLTEGDPTALIQDAQGIVVGGGDLRKLLTGIVDHLVLLKGKIQAATPYLGWNEGSVAVSPFYIVPPIIPESPHCIGAIPYQMYCHYVDSTENRLEINSFFINHQNDSIPINRVICQKDGPGGSGIRLEDDGSGLLYNPIPGTTPPLVFEFTGGTTIIT
jgi:peptidase E